MQFSDKIDKIGMNEGNFVLCSCKRTVHLNMKKEKQSEMAGSQK